jgi:hypothetical protein
MDRAQLLNIATRLLEWLNAPPNLDALHGLVSPDIIFPNPYPHRYQGLEGLILVMEKTHKASSDVKMTIRDTTIDETEKSVVLQTECTGTHEGLLQLSQKLTIVNGLVSRERGRSFLSKGLFLVR